MKAKIILKPLVVFLSAAFTYLRYKELYDIATVCIGIVCLMLLIFLYIFYRENIILHDIVSQLKFDYLKQDRLNSILKKQINSRQKAIDKLQKQLTKVESELALRQETIDRLLKRKL